MTDKEIEEALGLDLSVHENHLRLRILIAKLIDPAACVVPSYTDSYGNHLYILQATIPGVYPEREHSENGAWVHLPNWLDVLDVAIALPLPPGWSWQIASEGDTVHADLFARRAYADDQADFIFQTPLERPAEAYSKAWLKMKLAEMRKEYPFNG